MPIAKHLRHFYGRDWRTSTRPRILARADNRCEQCGAPNNTELTRVAGWWIEWIVEFGVTPVPYWRDEKGVRFGNADAAPERKSRNIRVVLTIAHLNHVAGDDRDENLKALCQWCHLHYDADHHRETRAIRKDAARPILQETTA